MQVEKFDAGPMRQSHDPQQRQGGSRSRQAGKDERLRLRPGAPQPAIHEGEGLESQPPVEERQAEAGLLMEPGPRRKPQPAGKLQGEQAVLSLQTSRKTGR